MKTHAARTLIKRKMSDSKANDIFDEMFNGHSNALTPYIIWRKIFDNYVIELSTGQSIFEPERNNYGVSVIKDNEHNTDLSDLFKTKQEAEDYIFQLVTEPADREETVVTISYPHYIEVNGTRYKKEKDGSYYKYDGENWNSIEKDELLQTLGM